MRSYFLLLIIVLFGFIKAFAQSNEDNEVSYTRDEKVYESSTKMALMLWVIEYTEIDSVNYN